MGKRVHLTCCHHADLNASSVKRGWRSALTITFPIKTPATQSCAQAKRHQEHGFAVSDMPVCQQTRLHGFSSIGASGISQGWYLGPLDFGALNPKPETLNPKPCLWILYSHLGSIARGTLSGATLGYESSSTEKSLLIAQNPKNILFLIQGNIGISIYSSFFRVT